MSDGINFKASIPWTLVAMAALGLAFMYRDVQHQKEEINDLKAAQSQGVSQAKIAELDARLDGQNIRVNDLVERIGRIERSRDWGQWRRDESRNP